jgi:predicted cupin superfamily sugar epimerase
MNQKAKIYIDKLDLRSHPEGGYFKEIYRSGEIILPEGLPKRLKKSRSVSTSIYFLLDGKQVSKFHRLKSDELWHFYDGSSVKIYIINDSGNLSKVILGKEVAKGEVFQSVIPAGHWFAAEVIDKDSFSLVGCTVAPGFEFEDFEIAGREELLKLFPIHEKFIIKFTDSLKKGAKKLP